MPEFNLVCTDEDGTVNQRFSSDTLPIVVEKVEDFLHGVGYVFDSLDLVVGKSDPIIKEDVIINTKETDDTILNFDHITLE
ncbi:MAG: hypothetical protein CM15mV11_3040 [Caudoviricetes sp.]|nr:MAG: hypothetical protein CM15mV11_3040 [Caudoviricetes sp.]